MVIKGHRFHRKQFNFMMDVNVRILMLLNISVMTVNGPPIDRKL